jgi:glycosyltransferase involved in cell wall biosynthesis
MRIVVGDYSGHPFQVQLSRELSRRGHTVLHLHFADFQTPKGRLKVEIGDPSTLSIEPVTLGRPFAKHSFFKRRFQEVEVGALFAEKIRRFAPDVVLASNFPLDTLKKVRSACKLGGWKFVFWQQDIYSMAIDRILTQKLGLLGRLIGKKYMALEKSLLRSSDAVVTISEDFIPWLTRTFGVQRDHINVIENWAPLDEIVPRPKENVWSLEKGLADKKLVLYTGTLGMKHDPSQILAIAKALQNQVNVAVVVVSEGPAAQWLADQAREQGVSCLSVLGFQPFSVYSEVLSAADVLISILEPDAGAFSVPSKVLSYLCAGRSIVLSAPQDGLASRIIAHTRAGIATPAGQPVQFAQAVKSLLDNPGERAEAGQRGRTYAEQAFDIVRIGDRFEAVLASLLQAEVPILQRVFAA